MAFLHHSTLCSLYFYKENTVANFSQMYLSPNVHQDSRHQQVCPDLLHSL